MSGRATTTKTKTKTSLRQRGKKDSSVLEKNSDAKTAKSAREEARKEEEELEETEEEGKTFDETVVSSTLFHSAKFEGREKLNFVRELFINEHFWGVTKNANS